MTSALVACQLLASVLLTAEDLNRYLYPKETTLVAFFDLAGMRGTGIFDDDLKATFDEIIQSNEQVKRLGKILSFDPSKDISAFTVCAGAQQGPDAPSLMIVNGEFPYDKIVAELEKLAESGELTAISINDLPVYFNHRSREAVFFGILDGKTVIASQSKLMLEDAIQGLTDLREPSEALAERLSWGNEERQSAPLIRLAGLFPETFRKAMGEFGPLAPIAEKMEGYNLTLHVEDEAMFQARLTLTDPSSAQTSVRVFRAMISMGKAALENADRRPDIVEMLGNVELTAKESDLFFDVKMTPETLKSMLAANREDRNEFRKRREEREQREERGEKEPAEAEEREESP